MKYYPLITLALFTVILFLFPMKSVEARPAKSILSSLYINNLKIQSFPCREGINGTRCILQVPDYPKRISVIIPHNLQSFEHFTVHFHGHLLTTRLYGLTPALAYEKEMQLFAYEERYKRSQSILIVPESDDFEADFNSYFISEHNFDRFFSIIGKIILKQDYFSPSLLVKGIRISGHSGAYEPIASICKLALESKVSFYLPLINDITLYDATYGELRDGVPDETAPFYYRAEDEGSMKGILLINTWAASSPENKKLVSYYVKDGPTQKGSLSLTGPNVVLISYPDITNYYYSYPYNIAHFQVLLEKFN